MDTGREGLGKPLRLFDGFRQLGRRALHAKVLFFTALGLGNYGNVLFRLFLMAAIDAEQLTVLGRELRAFIDLKSVRFDVIDMIRLLAKDQAATFAGNVSIRLHGALDDFCIDLLGELTPCHGSPPRNQRAKARYRDIARIQAAAAASGAGAGTDAPTVAMLGESIAGQSRLNQLMEIYGGESRARGYEDQAASRRASARSARLGGLIGAGTSILGGISRYKGIA